ncbi:non-ribosomal peptide synthetase [Streptomyces acidiscabies]|uniref:Phenyloxazoline synthase MbtB n=1 Tax=Streptomyces acidiscabies TaxID=42234 RepID=A0ABU4MD50_9ACTN|nr:non-ribosomal peptide synthetase [Streptomyces acidiscabies]MDX3025806.1 amino acid adenylation domain-containing protein [Streptomyces acidiscabies]
MTDQTIAAVHPATPAQQGFLLGTLAAPSDALFVEQAVLPLTGPLDMARLERALAGMVDGHEILRTGLAWNLAADPQQVVLTRGESTIGVVNSRGHDAARQQARLEELLRAERAQPFDLTRPPLLRLAVQHLDGERHRMVWTHHHGVLDGWSHLALVNELLQRYAGHIPPERPEFGAYARWLASQDRSRQQTYWSGHLAGYQPLPAIAEHLPFPDQERYGQHSLDLDAATAEALNGFARAHGTTTAAVLISGWGLVAARQRDRDDLAVGVTVSGRTGTFPGVADLIGPVATTMPIRLPAPVGDSGEWMSGVQDLLAQAEANSACSTADLYAWAGLAPGGTLYDSVVSIANYPHTGNGPASGLVLETAGIRSDGGRTRHPLALIVESFDGLRLRLVNDRTRVGDDEARAALDALHAMLRKLAAGAAPSVADLAVAAHGLAPFQPRPSTVESLPASGRAADDGDPLVRVLADAFADVLGQSVRADDDFLAAGGHSLLALRLATRLRTALGVDLTLGDMLTAGTPRALATRVRHLLNNDTLAPDPLPPLTPAPGTGEPFALTGIQQAYWTGRSADFDLGGVDSHLYTEADLPEVDLERLAAVWRALIARHPMLRAVTTPDGRQQILTDVPPYRIHTTDLRADADTEAELARMRERLAHPHRDTSAWPLFTVEAALLPGGATRLFLSFDLLIGDALSWQILYREACALYENPDAELPALEVTFADYVAHLPALAAGPHYERDRAYWRAKLPALLAPPALPLLPEPADPAGGPRFSRLQLCLPPDDLAALRHVAAAHGATLSALLMAAFAETLGTFTNTSAFLVNTTIYNRPGVHPQINQIVGDFTSTVLTGIDLGVAPTFAGRLRALQRQLWADLDHARYSGVEVLRDLQQARGRTGAVAPVVFTSTLDLEVPGAEPATAFPGTIGFGIGQTPQVLLDYQTYQVAGHLVINFDTVDGRLPDGLVQAMLQDHEAQLRTLIDDTSAPERPHLRAAAPAPELAAPLGGDRLLHEPFFAQAHRTPHATAIVCDGERTTYGDLADAARQIADRITAADPAGELVAVLCRPGREQAAATLGVLLAGYAYVPLDPSWPAERLHELLAATGSAVVVTEQETRTRTRLPAGLTVLLTDDLTPTTGPTADRAKRRRTADDLAYVIYTSGSTGRPKGVMISHRGALNTILDVNERFGIGATDAVLAVSPATFDLSVWDLFGTLAAGATLMVPTRGQRLDPAAWTALARAEHVTVWNSVPVLMDLLLDSLPPGDIVLEGLRVCLLSGDWIPLNVPGRLRERAPKCRIVSLGGATEGSIWSILHEIGDVDPAWSSIPYGCAMTGQSVQVLDDQLRPCPAHVPGQLYIGGHGTALGYWRAPELTEAAFVFDGRTGRRLYRTGDWGRLRPDGTLEFLGRRDAQVKIRGYRVELREVETALRAVPGVEQAAVVATGERTDRRLAAFAVTARPLDAVRADLARRLPAHMLPASFTALPELPLSATSKVDRGALERLAADLDRCAPQPAAGAARHDTGLEEKVRAALAAIVPGRAGLDDDLLAFGITSVDVIRLANAVEQHTGTRPDLKAFYAAPTLRTLLQHTDAPTDAPAPTAPGVWSGWPQLTDPEQRAAFRAARPAHGPAPASRTLPERPPGHLDLRARRRTPRAFDSRPVTLDAFADLLESLRRTDAGGRPAFLYPSAGGLYAVQVHLHVRPGRVQGLPGGLYGYHPDAHDLTPRASDIDLDPGIHLGPANRPLANTAAFTVFLAIDPADSAPLYGCDAEPLALLNAGYIGQLLCHTATETGLALAPVHGIDFDRIRWLLPDGERLVLLHTLLGGIPDRPATEGEPA